MKFLCLMLLAGGIFAQAQSFDMPSSPRSREAYSFDAFPLPNGILLYTLDREKVNLDTGGKLTFIQVWSMCCGAEPDVWATALDLSTTYRDYGLQTISVNFENGAGVGEQIEEVRKFMQGVTKPENLLLDGLGYAIDLLHVPGFPTYYLVDANRQVVFRTNGKDPEGLKLLRREIEKRLP